MNGASGDPYPPHPDIWSPGDISKRIWDHPLGAYVIWVADPETGEAIRPLMEEPEPYVPPEPVVIRPSGPAVTIARRGPSTWVIDPGLATFTFRNVVTHREMGADITVEVAGFRILRTTHSLSLNGRTSFTKALVARAGRIADSATWGSAVDLAFEAILDEQERLCVTTSLRDAPTPSMDQEFTVWPLVPSSVSMLVAPGETGKSTLLRALAVSVATGREVIPGVKPLVTGPVLYVASEDPKPRAHVRSIEAICRGAGIDRLLMGHDITLFSSTGKPLHRIVSQIAEMAPDYAFVAIDAMQGFLSVGEDVRNSAQLFWDAVDDIDAQALSVAGHPALAQSREWEQADGRAAGAEVSRDRVRMSWKQETRIVPTVPGADHAIVSLVNTKNNDGARFKEAYSHRRTWSPSEVTFSAVSAADIKASVAVGRPTKEIQTLIDAWDRGLRTPAQMKTGVTAYRDDDYETIRKRIYRAKQAGYLADDPE